MPKPQDAALEVEQWPVDRPIPYDKNPRIAPPAAVEKVATSLREYGWRQPIVVDDAGVVIVGHTRLLAARLLGMSMVPVHVAAGLSPEQAKAYRLADNRTGEESAWEYAALNDELRELADAGFDLELTGFDTDELTGLWKTEQPVEQDEVPQTSEDEPTTQRGDLYRLGRHRLLCGDATNAAEVERVLAGAYPGIMVTDPPYGVQYDPSWRHEAGINDSERMGSVANDDRADWREAWALFPGDVAYIWHSGLHAHEVANSLLAVGFTPRAQIIWVKNRIVIGRGHYHWRHEPALYAVRDDADDSWAEGADRAQDAAVRYLDGHEASVYAVRDGATADWGGSRKESTVWEIETGGQDADTTHGTQKPVECMARPIRNHDLQEVYDPFCGSGTTIIAAEQLGATCYALELEPAYCDVIVARWEALTGETAEVEHA